MASDRSMNERLAALETENAELRAKLAKIKDFFTTLEGGMVAGKKPSMNDMITAGTKLRELVKTL